MRNALTTTAAAPALPSHVIAYVVVDSYTEDADGQPTNVPTYEAMLFVRTEANRWAVADEGVRRNCEPGDDLDAGWDDRVRCNFQSLSLPRVAAIPVVKLPGWPSFEMAGFNHWLPLPAPLLR